MSQRRREIQSIDIEDIYVGERMRRVSEDRVAALSSSIKEIGLQTPISIRIVDGPVEIDGEEVWSVPCLIAGANRLAAVKSLGWEKIDCFVLDADDIEARLWEIAENLHRAELTVLERDQHIAEWIRLSEEKRKQEVSRQSDAKPSGGRPEGGVRAAARELGMSEPDARRAVKVAGLADDAKAAAIEAGLDDNRTALLEAAKADPDEQAEVIRAIAARKATPPPPEAPDNDLEPTNKIRRRLAAAWNAAPPVDREWFREWIDRKPVFDRTRSGRAA